jgi:hypothetical protein
MHSACFFVSVALQPSCTTAGIVGYSIFWLGGTALCTNQNNRSTVVVLRLRRRLLPLPLLNHSRVFATWRYIPVHLVLAQARFSPRGKQLSDCEPLSFIAVRAIANADKERLPDLVNDILGLPSTLLHYLDETDDHIGVTRVLFIEMDMPEHENAAANSSGTKRRRNVLKACENCRRR